MKNMNFNPDIERQSAKEIKHFQEEKLGKALQYLNSNSPFYKRMFEENKIDISKIKTLEDLQKIPFTSKNDLQQHNSDFLCVGKNKIIDYITTSGTLGDPVTFAMSEKDLDRLAYNEAISFKCVGAKPGEIYQLMTTIDKRFMAGLAYFLGIRKLGAGIIRVGNGIPEFQWDTITRISPDAIICVPSFIIRIIDYADEHGIDYRNSSIKKAVCIGENLREQDFTLNLLGKKIKEKWDIELYSTYASTEMGTTFTECSFGQGGHHHPELIITEIIDDDGNQLSDGEEGELVITTLGVEAMPLLRFKTGDIARFYSEPCPCGRTTKRISPIIGRKNQMIKLKGTTIYPAAFFDVLANTDYVENYYVEVTCDSVGNDNVNVYIGCKSKNINSKDIEKELKDHFRAQLRVAPNVIISDVETIKKVNSTDTKRKPVLFIDKRGENNSTNT
jgi:phenylacetate-CoA ligase